MIRFVSPIDSFEIVLTAEDRQVAARCQLQSGHIAYIKEDYQLDNLTSYLANAGFFDWRNMQPHEKLEAAVLAKIPFSWQYFTTFVDKVVTPRLILHHYQFRCNNA